MERVFRSPKYWTPLSCALSTKIPVFRSFEENRGEEKRKRTKKNNLLLRVPATEHWYDFDKIVENL
jgi:hypothetical protein